MFTMMKIALIGTCLFGTAANAARLSTTVHNYSVPSIQMVQKTEVKEHIGEKKAKSIALKDAGVKEKDTTYLTVHLDVDDGVEIYEVEFMVGNKEYDYDIDAYTGKILSKDFDIEGNNAAAATNGAVTVDKAKEIATANAGFAMSDVQFTKAYEEFDDGYKKIKIEFVVGKTEYEYDIDVATGKIMETSTDSIYDD